MLKAFRRTYFIYPEIQKPLIKQIIIGLSILNVVQIICLFFTMMWLEQIAKTNISLVVDFNVLGVWQKLLYASVVIPVIFNIAVNLLVTLYVSNKFAGPLFRLERELDQYLSGEKDSLDVNFRKKDYLHSLSKKINRLVNPEEKTH